MGCFLYRTSDIEFGWLKLIKSWVGYIVGYLYNYTCYVVCVLSIGVFLIIDSCVLVGMKNYWVLANYKERDSTK